MDTQFAIGKPQTGTTAANEFAKLRREQKLDVDKATHTRSHLEKLQKKELKKEVRHPTTHRELTVVPKWRRREHPANFRDAVRFGPDRVCQAANPRKDGPCRCTPCRQMQVQTGSLFISGQKEGPVCFDRRKRVGGTAALPTVAVDPWAGDDFGASESGREDENGPHTAEEGGLPRLHPTEVDIWDLVKPAKPRSQKHKGKHHLHGNMDSNAQRLYRMVDARSSAQCNTLCRRRFSLSIRGVGGAGRGSND
jgi:hypothetical protein